MFEGLQQWTNGIIENQLDSPIFFVAIFMFGLLAAIGSCCNVGVLAAVTSYAGAETQKGNKRSHYKTGLSFLLGNIIALSLVGALTGFISQTVGDTTGQYWKLIAGVLVVYFGLTSLDMLPSFLKFGKGLSGKVSKLANKGFLFGLLLGGFATACSVSCNPIFPVIMGASYLQGDLFLSWITLFVFALGYSLPLGLILVGSGLGIEKLSGNIEKSKVVIQWISGLLLIFLGFGLVLGMV